MIAEQYAATTAQNLRDTTTVVTVAILHFAVSCDIVVNPLANVLLFSAGTPDHLWQQQQAQQLYMHTVLVLLLKQKLNNYDGC
jgi:hypothetical protein